MLTRIHHVGVVVPSLDEGLKFWRDTLGMRLTKSATIEEQGVRAALLEVGGSEVELLEPLNAEGGVGKFLARRGEGIHHVGYGVSDIGEALATVAGTGIRLVDERPRHGSMGASIAFLHPADLGGVLTELVQLASSARLPHTGVKGI